MTQGGLSSVGLARLHEVMAGHVESGAVPGLIALVARHGAAHVDVIGAKAYGGASLARDDIFRIASLTKPIAAAAAMTLVDDGTLRLSDAVDRWLPAMADRRVLRSFDAELTDTVAARRPITVEDVLTFRLGFGAIMESDGQYPIEVAERELLLATLGPPWPPTPHTPDAWIERLGRLPLMHQPGERWLYNGGAQVLGILLERASGQPLEDLLGERIFRPLGMTDTAFSVAPEKMHRLTTAYFTDPLSGAVAVLDGVDGSYWSKPPALPSAAGWLVSTIDDYWAFAQMMVQGGRYRGRQVVSEPAVKRMTTDQLTAEQRAASKLFIGMFGSWGLGLGVPSGDPTTAAERGGIGWTGGTGTLWRSDLQSDLTGILFTQQAMTSPQPPALFDDFWDAAYAAVDD